MESFAPNFLTTNMPWRFKTAPHNGTSDIFLAPIPAFVCPSSELGTQSPNAGQTHVDINANNQAALHYRGNGGSQTLGFVAGRAPDAANTSYRGYTTSGVIYPESRVRMSDITDGSSTTFLLGEMSTARGINAPSSSWGRIQPWTWGTYCYEMIDSTHSGYLMIDHKFIQYPIGYKGTTLVNNAAFKSNHGTGGANFAFCDGSVRFLANSTALNVLQQLATRQGTEAITGYY